jgi:L-lactate dehydrogenase
VDGPRSAKVVVIGAGNVGATFAYGLIRSGLATEIVLIDADRARADGEAMDLSHAVPFERPTRVRAGDWPDVEGASVVVMAAGAGQRPGQSRLDLARRNAAVVRDVAPRVAAMAPSAIFVIASNPVDVLTYVALRASGLPPRQVLGSGTILDTARFRYLLADRFGIDARSVHAFMIGEHGDSEVPVWSSANIAGTRLREYFDASGEPYPDAELEDIRVRTRDAAYHIIEAKGATYYAVASGLVRITEAILRDQATVLSVSSLIDGPFGLSDVCLSLPTVVGRGGAERILPLALDDAELEGLRRSAAVVRAAIDQAGDGSDAGEPTA